MSIIINIDVMLAKRKMSVSQLTEKVGITMHCHFYFILLKLMMLQA